MAGNTYISRYDKSKPCATIESCSGRISLLERCEQILQDIRLNAYAGILDLHFQHNTMGLLHKLGGKLDTASTCEFDCIGQQIRENLPDSSRIAKDLDVRWYTRIKPEGQALLLRDMRPDFAYVIHDGRNSERDLFDCKMTRLDLRKVQYVVDDGKEISRRGLDAVCKVLLLKTHLSVTKEADHANDALRTLQDCCTLEGENHELTAIGVRNSCDICAHVSTE